MTLPKDDRPWYKERWPWILMAGPAAVIVAGIVTVWLAVVSNDGAVFPGDTIALRGAYALSLALQAGSGGGRADPHAGHHH